MNRIKTTTTSTGTGNITVSTTPAARCRPLSDIAAGKVVRMLIEDESGTDWELVNATIIDATSFSRGIVINGSAGPGVKVNFGAGIKTVFVAAVLVDPDIPFNATIPLDRPEIAYMAAYTMNGPLAFAAGANPVNGAHVVATIIGNGVDEPTFPGFAKHASSLPFNKTSGVKNVVQFLRTPGVSRYSISQAAADVVTTATGPTANAPSQMVAPVATATGNTTADVALTAPNSGGTAITGYTVVSNPPGGVDTDAGTTDLVHNMTGLTTNQAYTFTVTATNPVGTSPASPASNSITPGAAPTLAYQTLIAHGSFAESGTTVKTYTAALPDGNLNYGWGGTWAKHAPPQTDFVIEWEVSNDVPSWVMGLMGNSTDTLASSSVGGVAAMDGLVYGAQGGAGTGVPKASIAHATNDRCRLERINSAGTPGNMATLKFYVSKGGAALVQAFEVQNFPNGALWPRWHIEGIKNGQAPAITSLQAIGLVA